MIALMHAALVAGAAVPPPSRAAESCASAMGTLCANDRASHTECQRCLDANKRRLDEVECDFSEMLAFCEAAPPPPLEFTIRERQMSTVGREYWVEKNTVTRWNPNQTAIVVVDMWNKYPPWAANLTRSGREELGEDGAIVYRASACAGVWQY